MRPKIGLILALILIGKMAHSQIIDRYGVNIGASYSTQVWDYKLVNLDMDNKYKLGVQAFLHTEKDFGKFLALRTELGYLQKGFKEEIRLAFPDGTVIKKTTSGLTLHNLALNWGIKVKPIVSNYAPYLLIGLRGDYMISNSPIEIKESGSGKTFNIYEPFTKDFNKLNLGGLLAIGFDIKGLMYFEIEYNPNFTKNLDNKQLSVQDKSWGAKIGLNINKLMGK